MNHEIEEVVFDDLSDDEISPLVDRFNAFNREMRPRSVDRSIREFRIFSDSPGSVQRRFLARSDDGEVVGAGETDYSDDGSNPEMLRCRIYVWPEFRRRGAGSALLERICLEAERLQRPRLLARHVDTILAGAEFARAVGGVEKQQYHENVVKIADLDSGLLSRWVEQGPERAPGYRVEVMEDDWPEELHEDIAHLFYVLERDMPTSEDQEPRQWTADLIKEMMEHYKEGIDALYAMAFDVATGTAIGMSELIRVRSDPTTWEVTVTMVDPDHRGKSLGKWLKGAVNLAALDRWPEGVYEQTGNAFTNEAMLAINRAMGFEHELTVTDVEVAVAEARNFLESRKYSD